MKEFEFTEKIENPVHRLVKPGKEKIIGSWLLLAAAGVFLMVVVGNILTIKLYFYYFKVVIPDYLDLDYP